MYYTGKAPVQASYSSYDFYVLVDDNLITWDDIEKGMTRSRLGDAIKHCSVYQNMVLIVLFVSYFVYIPF